MQVKIRFRDKEDKIIKCSGIINAMQVNADWVKKAKKDDSILSVEYVD